MYNIRNKLYTVNNFIKENLPGVYADVSSQLDWIRSITGIRSPSKKTTTAQPTTKQTTQKTTISNG